MSASTRPPTAPRWTGALAGVLSALVGVALGTAVAAIVGAPSPVLSIGNRFIVFTPRWLKEFAIAQFGTADKPILIGSVAAMLLILAAAAGVIGLRKRAHAVTLTVLLGGVAMLAAATDTTTTVGLALGLLPTLTTLVVSVTALMLFLRSLSMGAQPGDDLPAGFNRRAFVATVLGTGLGISLSGLIARLVGRPAAAESRASVTIPSPAVPAGALPSGVQSPVEGVSSFITPNRDFYRIDTALQVPDVPAEGWSLRIRGMVDTEFDLTYRDLLAMRLLERRITLTCVSNEVGGPYVGTAAWIGVPVRDLLERAGVDPRADAVRSTSADGMTISTPLGALTDPDRDALVAVAMNGEPLPLRHGFPARLVVPGLYGYVSATKWLVELDVTRFADHQAYWTTRGYDAKAPIKLSSRIDVPASFQAMPADAVRVGGVAWSQHVGIDRVEVRIDDGEWIDADLADQDSIDTWRQWSWQWSKATPGPHRLTVRATNADGQTQTSDRAPVAPNGSTGLHSVQFRVE